LKTKKPILIKRDGNQQMRTFQVFFEPRLVEIMDKHASDTRSTYVRKLVKTDLINEYGHTKGIDWNEINQ
jgi:hypothetical protein